MDEISLTIEPKENLGKDVMKGVTQNLFQKLKNRTNLRFLIEVAPPGGLPRHTLKAKRFKDLRNVEGR